MKEYQTKEVRNVVLLGATKSGKTTLAEAMLFEGKVISRMGSIEVQLRSMQSSQAAKSTSSTPPVPTISSAVLILLSACARAASW